MSTLALTYELCAYPSGTIFSTDFADLGTHNKGCFPKQNTLYAIEKMKKGLLPEKQ